MRRNTAIVFLLAFSGALAGPPAWADCVQVGLTVTCTGNSPAGFSNFLVNGFTVTVQPGALVGGNGIGVNNNSTVSNFGSIAVGNGFAGVAVNNSSSILNAGTVTAGTSGTGLFGVTNTRIVNTGQVSVGSAVSAGVWLEGDRASLENSGSVRASGDGRAVIASGMSISISNTGVISAGAGGWAILHATGTGASVRNAGVIDGQIGLGSSGGNVLSNSGLVTISLPLTQAGAVRHDVDGTFTQTSAGTLGLRVNNSGAFDRLQVFNTVPGTGVANLGGRLLAVVQPGLYGGSTVYTGALAFAGSTRRFDSVAASTIFFNAIANYNAGSVDLVLNRIPFNQFPTGGANARAVGNALEANYSTTLTGSLAGFYGTLLQSSSPATLSQLTGEVATAPQSAAFGVFGQFLSTVLGQAATSRAAGQAAAVGGQPMALVRSTTGGGTRIAFALAEDFSSDYCDSTPRRVTAWAQGFGGAGSIDGDGAIGSSRVDLNAAGGALGVDMQITPNWLAGVTMGTTTSGFGLSDIASSGSARSIVLGFYGGYAQGPLYVDAALAYGYNAFNTTRSIATGSMSEVASGAFDGHQYGGRVEGGWRFAIDQHAVTPFAGMTVQALSQSGYSETSRDTTTGNPGLLGVTVQGQTATSVRPVLGLQFETTIAANDSAVLKPRVRLGWAHELNASRSATVALGILPGTPFQVTGAQAGADALLVGAGLELELGRMLRIFGRFDGDFAVNARGLSGTGGIRLVW
jgi:outer membrane autotransporter protein